MRLSPLLEWSSTSLIVITWLGGLSALFGAACGQLENDLKRVIAFSTTSQLGYYYIIYISLFILLTFIFLYLINFLLLSDSILLMNIQCPYYIRKYSSNTENSDKDILPKEGEYLFCYTD